MDTKPEDIIEFWFEKITKKDWWTNSTDFDATVRKQFSQVHRAAAAGELYSWRNDPKGRLAEIIVLDQFSRNLFRDQPAAFSCDAAALVLSQEALRCGAVESLEGAMCNFALMPYMHSESKAIHEEAVALFEKFAPGLMEYELKHKAIVDRFGRYPHRNKTLGRISTAEEEEFLKGPDSSF